MKSRGMAVIAAFVLIALAIVIRGRLTSDDATNGGGGKDSDGSVPVVACTPDLAAVCDALADAGDIAKGPPLLDLDDASAPDAEIDGWITWDPAPEIADFDAGQEEVWGPSEALGSARLAALIDPASSAALTDGCDADSVWACVATAPALGLSVGVGEPTSAEGLSRLLPLAAALTSELDAEAVDANEVRDIVESTSSQADATTMSRTATQPGIISIVVGPEAVLDQIVGSAQGKNRRLSTSVATPKTTVTVVLAARVGRDLGDLADACEDASVEQALVASGVVPCSDERDVDDVRVRAGFLYAIREKAS